MNQLVKGHWPQNLADDVKRRFDQWCPHREAADPVGGRFYIRNLRDRLHCHSDFLPLLLQMNQFIRNCTRRFVLDKRPASIEAMPL